MTAGRPPSGPIDKLISLAQFHFLRASLDVDEVGLALWLRKIPEGAMNESSLASFLRHESTIQIAHAQLLNGYVPGLMWVTSWPWRELTPAPRAAKLLRKAGSALAALPQRVIGSALPGGSAAVARFRSIANPEAWAATDAFFRALVAFRQSEQSEDGPKLYMKLISAFPEALAHPTIDSVKNELAFFVRGMPIHPLLELGLASTWGGFRKHYGIDFRGGRV
jgi:hypothetical protein